MIPKLVDHARRALYALLRTRADRYWAS